MSEPHLSAEVRIPDSLRALVQDKLEQAARDRVADRLNAGDPELWAAPGTPEVADRLGWLTIAERMLSAIDEVERFADGVRGDGFGDVVLLGMGGSSLAPEVLRRSFGAGPGHPRLHVLDSTDAEAILAVGRSVDLEHTLFIVSSKSGGTIEPLSLFAHFWDAVGRVREGPQGACFAAVTDPGSGLAELAASHGFRHTFLGDPNIGGRYSALSPFGIVPAALMGVDVRALLEGAADAARTRIEIDGAPAAEPAGVWLGAALSALATEGRNKLTFLIGDSFPGLGLWLEQLVAESTGKQGTGILPVAEEPVGVPADYGADRVFVHIGNPADGDAATLDEAVDALAAAGHPVVRMPAAGPTDLGRLFLLWELAVAVAGWGLAINPFDQPNVQQAKDATNAVLAGYEASGELPAVEPATTEQLRTLLDVSPPGYVAIMAYARPDDPTFDAAIAELRAAIRARGGATTTFGYGPRFLHSTGQFHKGGPKTGRFLQFVHDVAEDVSIPGRDFTFTTLKNAQATGDLQTLRELGLPAERVVLSEQDPVGAIRALTAEIKESR
ncbi:MAG TPA: hypothetical protein VH025_02035 [Solirubrobacteraceae bacterium]|nr:hypothetical protein [Solirubrobacteraceae bacterium]